MSDGLNALQDEDIQKLVKLIESLESSTFDYLQLQVGDVKVTIGKGAAPMGAVPMNAVLTSAVPTIAPASAAPPVYAPPPASAAKAAAPTGTIEIKSQIMGMFYAQPEPGAPPFVAIGTQVEKDSTVCLIEVMKTFNAMTAGVRGVITEICAENAQLVEYGQVLFRVRPS